MAAQIKSFSDFHGPSRESGEQVCFQYCPVCGSARWKTYVNPITGYWYCHAPEHSGGGRVDVGLPLNSRAEYIRSAMSRGGSPDRIEWSETLLPHWEPLSKRALRYLAKRGITAEHAARLGIVEMVDRMRVVVPYTGPDGRIIYWNARSYSSLEEGPKYLAASGRHPLYVLPNWQVADTLVLVEGVFDAISVAQHTGHTVAAMGGKALPSYLVPDVLAISGSRIVLLLDGDALASACKLRNQLHTKRSVSIVPLPMGVDPADMGEQLKEKLIG